MAQPRHPDLFGKGPSGRRHDSVESLLPRFALREGKDFDATVLDSAVLVTEEFDARLEGELRSKGRAFPVNQTSVEPEFVSKQFLGIALPHEVAPLHVRRARKPLQKADLYLVKEVRDPPLRWEFAGLPDGALLLTALEEPNQDAIRRGDFGRRQQFKAVRAMDDFFRPVGKLRQNIRLLRPVL